MSMTGLEVFDKTLQTTHIWLNEIAEELGGDRQRAYHALSAVLHALRDRLTIEECAHLAAQLPILLRGVYFHNWRPSRQPSREYTAEAFLAHVQQEFGNVTGAEEAVRAVLGLLDRHISVGEMDDIKSTLPDSIRRLWQPRAESAAQEQTAEAQRGSVQAAQQEQPVTPSRYPDEIVAPDR